MKRYILSSFVAAALTLTAGLSAQAQTIDRILKEKKIRIIAEVTAPPFGFFDKNGQPDGSEIATTKQLAKDLSVELELVQDTGAQRIPALLAGRADVAISSLSITIDRAKTVMFANPHGAHSMIFTAPASVKITSAEDLAKKRVGITRGTLEEDTFPKITPKDSQFVLFCDIAATIQALISGQVDCASFSSFIAKSVADRNPDKQLENIFTVATEYSAAAVKPGDFDLLHFLNTWVWLRLSDGTLGKIYEENTSVKLVDLPKF